MAFANESVAPLSENRGDRDGGDHVAVSDHGEARRAAGVVVVAPVPEAPRGRAQAQVPNGKGTVTLSHGRRPPAATLQVQEAPLKVRVITAAAAPPFSVLHLLLLCCGLRKIY